MENGLQIFVDGKAIGVAVPVELGIPDGMVQVTAFDKETKQAIVSFEKPPTDWRATFNHWAKIGGEHEIELELYLRRKGKYFFRTLDKAFSISAEVDEIPDELKSAKYGTRYTSKLSLS